ncbi:Rho-GAP domain-containing protein [Caenorhabditis elegans]|uniref:Rho-GAP domain-containing protein n=3 Tax=Caenorhabditis elegans TaxID=6239 RepID=Q965S4_CAEEL|nr:Rho-GAP domain-containing protein [Caenorhabditis elegans]CCD69560.1 Rho-GAP domain-containing protein [Caenorhabditis elegans]|eukprot:NP_001041201.1 Rho GTPase Activating protein [Caenorhabditis elegans]
MEHNDFRVVTSSSVYRKGSTTTAGAAAAGPKSNKLSYTLGEVCSTNVTLDVNVGTGWTRIRLKEVPKFIVHAFNIISKHGMDTDGIFRKEGNSVRLNRAEVQAIYKGQSDIPNDYSVIDVCTMVKRFLRDLKPPLLDSEECRARLLKKACQARISDSFLMTRDEMADIFYLEDRTIEQQTPLLSDVHASTLGYVMRQLYRIAAHSDQHKMSIENLAIVLVGSVFGDGIHDPRKTSQIRRGSKEDILAQKRQDMSVNTAAVKLLITNANLIGVRRDPYVTSNAMLRSSSAMPRCMSSGYETSSSDADCLSSNIAQTAAAALHQRGEAGAGGPSTSLAIHRRDSEAVHKIVTSRKKGELLESKKKRSASFLPSFRDLKHRLSNMKRAKSPSPERLMTGHTAAAIEPPLTADTLDLYTDHRKKVARNESNTMSTGSTASGRQSRSHQNRRGNTNAAPRSGGSGKNTISKMFEHEQQQVVPSSGGALRRLSANDQNTDAMRFAKQRVSNEQMSVAEFLISEHQRERECKIQKRNTVILGEKSRSSKLTNRRHTAPINNNRLRRNRPNTVGAGLPHRKDGGSSLEEKENQADCEETTDDTLDATNNVDHSEWLLEQKALEARSRRAGRKNKAATTTTTAMRNISTESMMVLNGSMMAVESTTDVLKADPLVAMDVLKEESSPHTTTTPKNTPKVVLRKDLNDVKRMKQFCDMATSPMVMDTPTKLSHENGHAWVGTKQVISVTRTPSLSRRQSRARLSYSKATESPLDMPSSDVRRDSGSLMSPLLKHVTITNNSPPSQVITSSPRTNHLTPKSHTLSPLAVKIERSTPLPPPPIPPHSPPHLTPQRTSKVSLDAVSEMKRISISGGHARRPPTPPSHPRVSNPFSPKLPIRSVTIDNGFELPATASTAAAAAGVPDETQFKLPQLPMPPKKKVSPLLARQATHSSKSTTLSVPNRANLRETKSIDETPTALRSAPPAAQGSSSNQLSPRSSTDYFEFGKYTNALRSATDEFALPTRKTSVESRPSVAILRSNNCGLVRSRVNHFQEIEHSQRVETSMSGRLSAMSQSSLRSSNDTHQSSSDRFSDVSDLRNAAFSESTSDSALSTPTATPTTSRVSTNDAAAAAAAAQHF